jgi:hypothetical protein
MARRSVVAPDAESLSPDPAESKDRRIAAAQRIVHLFRCSIREGTINPLMHLVARHRMESLP